PPLVDQRVDIAALSGGAATPWLGDELELVVLDVRDRANVPAAVDDHLLALERRIEVRHDPHAPLACLGQHERLRRSHVLVAGAERTRLELPLRWWVQRRSYRTRTLGSARRDHGDAARLRIPA